MLALIQQLPLQNTRTRPSEALCPRGEETLTRPPGIRGGTRGPPHPRPAAHPALQPNGPAPPASPGASSRRARGFAHGSLAALHGGRGEGGKQTLFRVHRVGTEGLSEGK